MNESQDYIELYKRISHIKEKNIAKIQLYEVTEKYCCHSVMCYSADIRPLMHNYRKKGVINAIDENNLLHTPARTDSMSLHRKKYCTPGQDVHKSTANMSGS